MSEEPTPYTPPGGMVLTTLGEVRRLGLDWAWASEVGSGRQRQPHTHPMAPVGSVVFAYPKPRPTVEIDAEALVALWDSIKVCQVPGPDLDRCKAAVLVARAALS